MVAGEVADLNRAKLEVDRTNCVTGRDVYPASPKSASSAEQFIGADGRLLCSAVTMGARSQADIDLIDRLEQFGNHVVWRSRSRMIFWMLR